MDELAPGDRIGPYVIRSELGVGGMGRVFLADRPGATDTFAVKVVRQELARDPLIERRFLREAKATSGVSHPRLVAVLDSGTADGRAFLAMRHIEGKSVDQLLLETVVLEPAETVRIVADVAGALDALHQAGLIHRDVKPSNVLVDGDGHATLMDLGLARGSDMSVLTSAGNVVGTIVYLAPELIRGTAEASPASDVYALGCLAFEALTGRPPFLGNMFEIGMGHLDQEPPPAHTLRPELPEGMSEALALALEKDPARRPPSATALAMMLRVGMR
jgi:serine/threonine protein kinase